MFGRIFCIFGLALLYFAYWNFARQSFKSKAIGDYVKNHFVREIIFGSFLSAYAIHLTLGDMVPIQLLQLGVVGSVVVLPFWIAAAFGWVSGGLSDVWNGAIDESAAYKLHGTQTVTFYFGLALLYFGME